jgi:serine/threonine-protein kinase
MNSQGDELVPRTTVAVGDRIVGGRYLVRAVIGKGGVGHVFEVENESIGRRFALKILLWNLVEPDQIKRFHREARALGRVSSPYVAQVIDFAVDAQIGPYLVMELLHGETLRDLLARRGPLPVDEAVALARELCQALDEVHRVGIVHRDLKPSNIGLPRGGNVRVKLLDFGLAASYDGAFTEQLTQSQQFLGTMPYMAPELFRGTAPSPSFDLYALGVVLFQMLTGQTPYQGPTPAVYIQQHLFAPIPRLREVAPERQIPAWLDELVQNLLAKAPEERLPSAVAVAGVLATGQAGRPVKLEAPRGWRWRRWVLAGTALAALGIGAAVVAHRRARPAPPLSPQAPPKNEGPPVAAPIATAATTAPAPAPPPTNPPPADAPSPFAPSSVAPSSVAPSSPVAPHAPSRKRPPHRAPPKPNEKSQPWQGEIIESE